MNHGIPRRGFLADSLAATAAIGALAIRGLAADEPQPGKREVYELRVYQLKLGDMMKRADDYFQNALVPALRRAGAGPVGVFVESSKPDAPAVYVLIPHPSLETVVALPAKFQADADYQKSGAAFLTAPPKEPAYTNLEARLMLAADFLPRLETPEKKDTRVFELRRYRSPSEPAFRKKLEMFGKLGELAIFRRVGLAPVFYGEMMMGPDMPNITYMLTYPDAAARTRGWNAFGRDPDWLKLPPMPGYTDPEIIADIKSLTLKPTPCSQI